MILPTKSDIVLFLIKKASEDKTIDTPGMMGKKALQKSMYFFNESFNLFTFKWRDYGPMSGELQQIASDFISTGKVKVLEIPTKKNGIYITNMTFNNEYEAIFSDIEISTEINDKLNEIVHFIKGKRPRDLELFASVHYWAKRQLAMMNEYNAEYIHKKLTELKPDVGFTYDDVESAINTLRSNNYLE